MESVRVLVVDDYEPICRLISTILENPTFTIAGQAFDGLEAVQKATELQPDLILLDIGLPQLNGIEAAKRIRNLAPHSQLLFVSQETSPEIVEAAFSVGARGYVDKNRILRDLIPAIESVLAGRQFVSRGMEVHQLADDVNLRIRNDDERKRARAVLVRRD